MNRRDFLKAVGLGVSVVAMPRRVFANQKPRKHPNIIFIMADDMGYGDVSCYNPASKIPTPNMDRLAKEGVRFTDAHSPSAVCTPTRYGVLTGRYCWRTRLKRGVFGGFNRPLIEKDRLTVASFLKHHGYSTACIGKWHLGLHWTTRDRTRPAEFRAYDQRNIDFSKPITAGPTELGFDYFFGTSACTTDDPPFCFIENDHTVGIPNMVSPVDPADEDRELLMVPGWKHEDADITFVKKSIEFIERHVSDKTNDLFFLYLPLSVPHIPWLPPDFVKGKSQAGPRGDQVVLADWSIEQVLETLDRMKISDNTLVILTSDNGPREGVNGHKSAGDLRGLKGSIWEGGHRVPFIARWQGTIKPDTTSDEVICLTDLMATCAAIVGGELPKDAAEDSYNILPALLGKRLTRPIREAVIHHSGGGVFAVRQGKWKLILGTKGSGADRPPKPHFRGQLYDLYNDPYEKDNLWYRHQEVIKRLAKLLEKYKEQGYSRRP